MRKTIVGSTIGAAALFASAGLVAAASVTVTEDDIGDTWIPNVVGDDSGISISDEFGAPDGLGDAALRLTTENDNQARAELGIEVDVRLDEVGELGYWTYQLAGNPALAGVAYKMLVTFDDGWTFLVHEPYWQNGTGDPDPVVGQTWQEWTNIEDGNWWSSRTSGGLDAGFGGPPFYTIEAVLALQPDARVQFVQLGIGSFNPDWDVLADGLTFAGTTYDFEQAPPVEPTKGDCKHGGWTDADLHGQEFRNQGQCVSFYASDGHAGDPSP